MNHKPTDEQIAILKAVHDTNDNLLIDAKAGCGKTSTILSSLGNLSMKNRSALLCAFNKRIAGELKTRMPQLPRTHAAHIKTFHALGLRVIKQHYPHLEVNSNATEELVNKVLPEKTNFWVRRSVNRLVRALKETMFDPSAELKISDVIDCGMQFNCFDKIGGDQISNAARFAIGVYEAGADVAERTTIDFCDMVWLPCVLNLNPPSRYQVVFVDELQDISAPQFRLIQMHMVPKIGRLIGVGDRSQSIYAWRGADGTRAWRTMQTEYKAKTLPLTITFRCSRAVVAEANRLVPELRAREGASDGSIGLIDWRGLPQTAIDETIPGSPDPNTGEIYQPSVYVLSRTNADLLQAVLYLWKNRVRFTLNAGDEFLDPLLTILDKLDLRNFLSSLLIWYTTESQRARSTGSVAYADKIEEQFNMLSVASRYTEPHKIADLLKSITRDKGAAITCSTVHKVKGLEADSVFLLKQTFASYGRPAWMTDPIDQEELNIEYVAITRAREHLYWVDMNGPDYLSIESPSAVDGVDGAIVARVMHHFDYPQGEMAQELAEQNPDPGAEADAYDAQEEAAAIAELRRDPSLLAIKRNPRLL